MGRPKKEEFRRDSIFKMRICESDMDLLNELSHDLGINRSEIMREALRDYYIKKIVLGQN